MSIQKIDTHQNLNKRLTTAFVIGGAVGAGVMSTQKSWLYKNNPSDIFVKNVKENLKNEASPETKNEATLINSFVKSVVDPQVDVETLKPQIKASKELSEAIKSNPNEEVEVAIERVFSNPDKTQVKKELLDLQYKTTSDKVYSKNTALKLIHDNFDAETQTLKKSEKTTEKMFNMLKSTAKKMQVKNAVVAGVVTGLVTLGAALICTDVDKLKK